MFDTIYNMAHGFRGNLWTNVLDVVDVIPRSCIYQQTQSASGVIMIRDQIHEVLLDGINEFN